MLDWRNEVNPPAYTSSSLTATGKRMSSYLSQALVFDGLRNCPHLAQCNHIEAPLAAAMSTVSRMRAAYWMLRVHEYCTAILPLRAYHADPTYPD